MDDLIAFLAARLDEAEVAARDLLRTAQDVRLALQDPRLLGRVMPGWHSWPDVEAMCESALREVTAKRAILAEHLHLETDGVEPAFGCRICHNDREWGIGCEGWCLTVRLLATEFSDHPDYRPEWALGD